MRRAKYILALACFAFAAIACQKELQPQMSDEEPLKIIIRAGAPQTRTAIIGDGQGHYTPSWSANDSIGVYFTNISGSPTAFVNATAGSEGHFSPASKITGLGGSQTLYAFYPKGAFAAVKNDAANIVRLNVKDPQKPDAIGTFDKSADLLVARPYNGTFSTINTTDQIVELAFARLLSVVKITPADATSGNALSGEYVRSLKIEYNGTTSDAPLNGRVELNLATGEMGDWTIKNYSATALYDEEAFALDGENAAYLLVNPITIAGGKKVTFTVTTDNFVASKTFTLGSAGMTFPAGNIATIGLNINDNWDIHGNSNVIIQVPFTADISSNTTYNANTHGDLGVTGLSKSSVSYTFSGSNQLRNNNNRIPGCGSFYWCSSSTSLVIGGINTGTERYFNLSFDSKLTQNASSTIAFSLSGDGTDFVSITSVNVSGTTAANYGFNFSIPAGEHSNLRLKIENTGSTGAVIDNLTITRLDSPGADNHQVDLPSSTPTPDPDPDPDPTPSAQPGWLGNYEVPTVTNLSGSTYAQTGTFSDYSDTWYRYNTTNAKQQIAVHTYNNTRTYVTFYDESKYAPLWTAHAMHASMWPDNDAGRKDAWTNDPAISLTQQGGLDNAQAVGYSRGHFVASNYRQTAENQNKQTFYYSNQAPQWQNSFNSGVWSSLEERVASSDVVPTGRDTLYVVVGVLYEGTTTTLPSGKGKLNVPIPSHFYTCLMKCSFDNSHEVTAASGIAFIYTNEAHSGVKYYDSAFVTSIDAIEARTGLDFFPRVPSSLQATAEANTTHYWLTGQN